MQRSLVVVLIAFLLWFTPQRIYDLVDASKLFMNAFRPVFVTPADHAASASEPQL